MARLLFIVKDVYRVERQGVQILSSVVKKNGHKCSAIVGRGQTYAKLFTLIKNFKPDFIGYSAMTSEEDFCLELNSRLKKELNYISIFGGPHFTFFPEEINNPDIDFICRGEGEGAITEVLNVFDRGESLEKIKNLTFKKNGNIINNPLRPLILDLDAIPFVDREIFKEKIVDIKSGHLRAVFCGRGCPFNCSYCFNHQYHKMYQELGKTLRWRTPNNIITELKYLKNDLNTQFIHFCDDTLTSAPIIWLEELMDKYKQYIKLPFLCLTRPDLITEEKIRLLSNAGFHSVMVGIECADEVVSKIILKRGDIVNQDIKNAIALFHKYKIKIHTENMIGLPVRKPLIDAFKTIALNIECKPTYAHFSILYPYPGTEIKKYCIEKGFLKDGRSIKSITSKSRTTLDFSPDLARKISNLHKLAGITVRFPVIMPLTKLLIKFPYNRVYEYIFYLVLAYNWGRYIFNYPINFQLIIKGIREVKNYLKNDWCLQYR
ncbi:MAG: cobalamin-dependent protein [Candidatus Omnitrophica bacterium]|nr:cobalamin-dependent protein [Candidatus Omnitrophota bacterium]MCK5492036.1 cobalamin-dependent protein [Candidatus Omnitrophota bacterium]